MNFLDPTQDNIKQAIKTHKSELKILVLERINKLKRARSIKIFKAHITPKLDNILTGRPNTILKLSKSIHPYLVKGKVFKEDVEYVFNYTSWFSTKKDKMYCAYDLAENLNISTCIYCNRLYTKTVIKSKNKITRPQFDHWFAKEEHPLLALSFFNLIPSCSY